METEERAHKFIHKIPIPDFYRESSKVLKKYCEKEGSLQKLIPEICNQRLFHRVKAVLYKLIDKVSILKQALTEIKLFEEQPQFNCYMAIILAYHLLQQDVLQLPGQCKPIQVINTYASKLKKWFKYKNIDWDANTTQKKINYPRYVRINVSATEEEVHQILYELGWYYNEYDRDTLLYKEFVENVKSMEGNNYTSDYQIPSLLVFPSGTSFWNTALYDDNHIILQDKASCLSAYLSGVEPGDFVIDACAAPGNKTTHLAAIMKNKGRIVAIDRDETRFKKLKSLVESKGVTCCEFLNADFTSIRHSEFHDAKVILVDPSCSASGASFHTDDVSEQRINHLSCMQFKLLSHALSFPRVQTVVYSTCSTNEKENEGVVAETLNKHKKDFYLEDLKSYLPGWKHFGLENYDFGSKCVRTSKKRDLCQGFFVAKFKKKENNSSPEDINFNLVENKKIELKEEITCDDIKKSKKRKHEEKLNESDELLIEDKIKKVKIKNNSEILDKGENVSAINVSSDDVEICNKAKKSKKKKKEKFIDDENKEILMNENKTENKVSSDDLKICDKVKKSKKKKKEKFIDENKEILINENKIEENTTKKSKYTSAPEKIIDKNKLVTSEIDKLVKKSKKKKHEILINIDETEKTCKNYKEKSVTEKQIDTKTFKTNENTNDDIFCDKFTKKRHENLNYECQEISKYDIEKGIVLNSDKTSKRKSKKCKYNKELKDDTEIDVNFNNDTEIDVNSNNIEKCSQTSSEKNEFESMFLKQGKRKNSNAMEQTKTESESCNNVAVELLQAKSNKKHKHKRKNE